jgi:hypothetical protein
MALNCLAGCVSQYIKGDVGVRQPIDAEGLMPWVEVSFVSGKKIISVSNFSSKNISAVIKSFKFGMSSGNGVEVEIVDEAGGQFAEFFNRISYGNLDAGGFAATVGAFAANLVAGAGNLIGGLLGGGKGGTPKSNILMQFRWGWATAKCDGIDSSNIETRTNCCASQRKLISCTHTCIVRKIKTDVSHGLFKYTIEGTDFTGEVMGTRVYDVFGSEKNPITVVSAIKKMFSAIGIDVDFVQWDSSCGFSPLEFRVEGKIDQANGSISTFRALGTNPLQAAMQWLSQLVTKKGKGITWFWDNRDGKQVLVFVETNQISCDVNRNVDAYNLGTYVIGSKCSPVLSFNPDIEYVLADRMAQTLSFQGGALSSKMGKDDSYQIPCMNNHPGILNQGRQAVSNASNTAYDIFREAVGTKLSNNRLESYHANIVHRPIKAELRIQGDPSYDRPIFCRGHFLSVVFIRPFTIGANTANGCDWLANNNPCDDLLSNCKWMIDGIAHQITPGSYTTSIQIRLAAPGADIPVGTFAKC